MSNFITDIINDTLKKNGKWSRVSLTMCTAFWLGNFYAIYDFFKNGFRIEVFLIWMSMATGMKIIDLLDKWNIMKHIKK